MPQSAVKTAPAVAPESASPPLRVAVIGASYWVTLVEQQLAAAAAQKAA